MKSALVALILSAAPALAEVEIINTRYACERGVTVPAAYVNGGETSAVVLQVEGSQVVLYAERAASGVRYAWPSDGAGYVWWTKGDEATLYWRDGEGGEETALLDGCREG